MVNKLSEMIYYRIERKKNRKGTDWVIKTDDLL